MKQIEFKGSRVIGAKAKYVGRGIPVKNKKNFFSGGAVFYSMRELTIFILHGRLL